LAYQAKATINGFLFLVQKIVKMIRINLKNKLLFGFGFLFFMIILLWIIGGYFIYDLSNRSAAMLKENYQTVESTRHLIQSIDELKNQQIKYFLDQRQLFSDSIYFQNKNTFNKHLSDAQNNITEVGEQLIIEQLTLTYTSYLNTFEQLKKVNPPDSQNIFQTLIPEYTAARNLILDLWDMNMDAIGAKNRLLKSTAHRAFVIISLIGTFCFIISALFFFRYPRNIARPIGELIRGITQIANRNYSQRLNFQSNDELGELANAFNSMAAKLDEYEHSNVSELVFEKKRIDTIINNMKDAIIGLNDKNEIIFSNTYACSLLQMKEPALIGKQATELALNNPVFNLLLHDFFEKKPTDFKEFKPIRMVLNDKVRYFTREILEVNITKTGESRPIQAGYVIVLKNVTRYLEQDEAKTNFIATISHELKTPISSLKLNLKLLDDSRIGQLNQEQLDIVKALKSETNKMLTLTSELLDLAQVESGNIQLNLQTISPLKILEYIKETTENTAKTKQITLEFNTKPSLSKITADYEKTAWVLINLINNAILYSPSGKTVHVSVAQNEREVIFAVKDFGQGIEPQYLELIFQKFFRVPNTREKGTGMGLAIAKEFITKQNGKIWAESVPSQGSTFLFSLPIAPSK
jgi:signal transduction histidine kinase